MAKVKEVRQAVEAPEVREVSFEKVKQVNCPRCGGEAICVGLRAEEKEVWRCLRGSCNALFLAQGGACLTEPIEVGKPEILYKLPSEKEVEFKFQSNLMSGLPEHKAQGLLGTTAKGEVTTWRVYKLHERAIDLRGAAIQVARGIMTGQSVTIEVLPELPPPPTAQERRTAKLIKTESLEQEAARCDEVAEEAWKDLRMIGGIMPLNKIFTHRQTAKNLREEAARLREEIERDK